MTSIRKDLLANKFSTEILKEMSGDIYECSKSLERLEQVVLNTEKVLYERLTEKIDEIDKYAEQLLVGMEQETLSLFKQEYQKTINKIVLDFEKSAKKSLEKNEKKYSFYKLPIIIMFVSSFFWAAGGFFIGKYANSLNTKNNLEIIKVLDIDSIKSIKGSG